MARCEVASFRVGVSLADAGLRDRWFCGVLDPVGVLVPVGVRDPGVDTDPTDDLEPSDDLDPVAERVEVVDLGVEVTRPGLRDRAPVGVIPPVGVLVPVGVTRPLLMLDRGVEVGVLRPDRGVVTSVADALATVRLGVVRKPGNTMRLINIRLL